MNDKKSYIVKKYKLSYNNIKDNHIKYYYTTYPELCCKYDLKPIDKSVGPFEFNKAIQILNDYYKDIKSSYYKDLLDATLKYGNDIAKYPKNIADRIIFEYIKFREKTFCLTIWPYVGNDLSQLLKFLSNYGIVYYVKKIKLNYNGALNLVHQLYSDTKRFPTIDKLKEKLDYLGWKEGESNYVRAIFFENTSNEVISGSQAHLKTKIRQFLLNTVSNKNLRGDDLVHINDYYYQTIEYSKIFLHKKTISFLKKQNLKRHLNDNLANCRLYFNTIKQWMIQNIDQIDYERFLFFGSLILYVYGLRNCRDIDGLVYGSDNIRTPNMINKTAEYFYNNTKFFFGSLGIMNTKYWKDEWDTKDIGWLKIMGIKHKDEMIFNPENHFYFNGIKILTIRNEIIRKFIRRKPQDYADMIAIIDMLGFKMNLPKIKNMDNSFINDIKHTLQQKYNYNNDDIIRLTKLYC